MSKQHKQKRLRPLVVILSCAIILAVTAGCGSEPSDEDSNESTKKDAKQSTSSKTGLNDIVRAARTWGPAYQSWYGKMAPDFILNDINGKQHKLSDYHGKEVMLVFWATWCRPCIVEVPHLIELRKTISKDKVAILAISNEDPAKVKKFAAEQKLNYTVLLGPRNMPSPYSLVNAIPSSFFIDSEGKIKLGTLGLMSLREMKAILQADPVY